MIDIATLVRDLQRIREKKPLIHNITNYVAANFTANALLAIGASPIMAHAINEVEEMVEKSSCLVLNIGTIDNELLNAMLLAGKTANKRQLPIVFDPVGAGATHYRTSKSIEIIDKIKPSVICGNASEIAAIKDDRHISKGVDSLIKSDKAINEAKSIAAQNGSIVCISGAIDYITDGIYTERVSYGSPLMEQVTGMGCTATAIIGAFLAINDNAYEATCHAMAIVAIVGELAAQKAEGTGSMQVLFLDELCRINESIIRKHIK